MPATAAGAADGGLPGRAQVSDRVSDAHRVTAVTLMLLRSERAAFSHLTSHISRHTPRAAPRRRQLARRRLLYSAALTVVDLHLDMFDDDMFRSHSAFV